MNIEIRSKILKYSLELEYLFNLDLAVILELINPEKSKSLGNTSSALSLNQKLNLMLDFETISKREKNIIESFSSIRNQFIHNYNANSYTYVINQISGLDNRLKKIYPNHFNYKNINIETIYEICVDNLYRDSLSVLSNHRGKKLTKLKRDEYNKGNEELYIGLNEIFEEFIRAIESKIEKYPKETISKSKILNLLLKLEINYSIKRNILLRKIRDEYLKKTTYNNV